MTDLTQGSLQRHLWVMALPMTQTLLSTSNVWPSSENVPEVTVWSILVFEGVFEGSDDVVPGAFSGCMGLHLLVGYLQTVTIGT